jgi:hypothetical protein
VRPGEERYSPPGQELLGVVTSHGPFRESYTIAQKASRRGGESAEHDGRGGGVVCSRDASSVFIRGKHASGIAVRAAGRQRGSGRSGRRSNATGKRCWAKPNATARAGASGSGPRAGSQHSQRQLARVRG